jgi:hypothetical protein
MGRRHAAISEVPSKRPGFIREALQHFFPLFLAD